MLIHCCELFCFLFQLLILKVKVHVCDLIQEILFTEQYKKKKKASKSMAFTFYSTQHQSLFYKLSFVFPKPQTQAKGFQKCFRTYRTPLMYLLLEASFHSTNIYGIHSACWIQVLEIKREIIKQLSCLRKQPGETQTEKEIMEKWSD